MLRLRYLQSFCVSLESLQANLYHKRPSQGFYVSHIMQVR
jgi:hypothetical protein